MGNNPSRNPFRRTRLGLDDQQAVDAYKADSIWGAWWQLPESTRRRYFTADERKFMRRWGAKLDELSCQLAMPTTDKERHFVQVCQGHAEPVSPRERLWLYAQMVCRYERSLMRAARTDLVEYENAALRVENRSLRADLVALEREAMEMVGELRMLRGDDPPSICNVVWMTGRFQRPEPVAGPPAHRPVMSAARRGAPSQTLPTMQ